MMILRISRVCEESRRFADDMSVSEEGEGEEGDDGEHLLHLEQIQAIPVPALSEDEILKPSIGYRSRISIKKLVD